MTENKRFELKVNQRNQYDIVDWVESKEKNAICIYNDLGSYHFSSAKALCKLLNELAEENKRLKSINQDYCNYIGDFEDDFIRLAEENKKLQERNDRQYKQLGDLYRLIEEKDWRALSDIMDDFKKAEEQLQKEWKCYE